MDIVTLDIELGVCCEACGKVLYFNQDNHVLFVRPCASCSNEVRNEGYSDGYNRRLKNNKKGRR